MERRRGWLAPGELEAYLETLPDAEGKIHEPTAEELAEASGAAEVETAEPGSNPA
jgi:hypothetical protein